MTVTGEGGLRDRISEARLALLDKPDIERALDILEDILSRIDRQALAAPAPDTLSDARAIVKREIGQAKSERPADPNIVAALAAALEWIDTAQRLRGLDTEAEERGAGG